MPIALNCHKDTLQDKEHVIIGLTHSSCNSFRIAGILVAEGGRGFTRGFTAVGEKDESNMYEWAHHLIHHTTASFMQRSCHGSTR